MKNNRNIIYFLIFYIIIEYVLFIFVDYNCRKFNHLIEYKYYIIYNINI